MLAYKDLNTAHRGDPCIEYPGVYEIFVNGALFASFVGNDSAKDDAIMIAKLENDRNPIAAKVSVCWKASDNDPRIGLVWFTGFYQLGWFDNFGVWHN